MNRVADACGLPLDTGTSLATESLRRELQLGLMASASHTRPSGFLRRRLSALVEPMTGPAMRVMNKISRAGGR